MKLQLIKSLRLQWTVQVYATRRSIIVRYVRWICLGEANKGNRRGNNNGKSCPPPFGSNFPFNYFIVKGDVLLMYNCSKSDVKMICSSLCCKSVMLVMYQSWNCCVKVVFLLCSYTTTTYHFYNSFTAFLQHLSTWTFTKQ